MKTETYSNYYSAKFARQKKERPKDWVIYSSSRKKWELRKIGG